MEEWFEARVLPSTTPPRRSGWVSLALEILAPTDVWALDNLDRFIWTLGIARQLESLAVLGCWVISPTRFAAVFRSAELGTFGIVVDQDPEGDAGRAAADRLVALSSAELAAWRDRGWVKDGVVWDRDPAALVTPWQERPPEPGDPLRSPDGDHSWSRQPPSTDPDPVEAAINDLQRRVVHDMWSSTALTLLITYPTGYRRSALRLSAAWLCAPDSFAYVETHLWPRGPGRFQDPVLLESLRLPGQRFLRFGEYISPRTSPAQSALICARHAEMELDGIAYPRGVDQYRTLRDGILWDERIPPVTYRTDRDAASRMAAVLHAALDAT
ncbi:hypothetical protein [Microlunatus sp. GCM10028923]|uniref:hypothetical protein n=1 Tax=Microlunatus sp. GCM10028923 TaxID=3273400 RepID=UPI0036154152